VLSLVPSCLGELELGRATLTIGEPILADAELLTGSMSSRGGSDLSWSLSLKAVLPDSE